MDEQAIRQWAWDEFAGWTTGQIAEDGKESFVDWSIPYRLENADALAAWVMSGRLPEPPSSQDQ